MNDNKCIISINSCNFINIFETLHIYLYLYFLLYYHITLYQFICYYYSISNNIYQWHFFIFVLHFYPSNVIKYLSYFNNIYLHTNYFAHMCNEIYVDSNIFYQDYITLFPIILKYYWLIWVIFVNIYQKILSTLCSRIVRVVTSRNFRQMCLWFDSML